MVDYRVRAMTWNIWWRFGPRWRERQSGILVTIERFTPDVVGLQEVWSRDGIQPSEQVRRAIRAWLSQKRVLPKPARKRVARRSI